MYNETWDKFFGNPVLGSYLSEAEEIQPQEQPAPQSEALASPEQLQQLSADLKEGTLAQDDLISMYKAGKLSKEEIQMVVDGAQEATQQEVQTASEPGEEQPTEEELFAQQLDQTNDMFIKFSLYDKTLDLVDKLNYFKENFEDIQSDEYQKVIQLREFLNILSNLIFNIETSVAYQMYGSILLQLTEIFNEYKDKDEAGALKDAIKDKSKEDYRDGSKSADPIDNWADENRADDMPETSTVHQMTQANT